MRVTLPAPQVTEQEDQGDQWLQPPSCRTSAWREQGRQRLRALSERPGLARPGSLLINRAGRPGGEEQDAWAGWSTSQKGQQQGFSGPSRPQGLGPVPHPGPARPLTLTAVVALAQAARPRLDGWPQAGVTGDVAGPPPLLGARPAGGRALGPLRPWGPAFLAVCWGEHHCPSDLPRDCPTQQSPALGSELDAPGGCWQGADTRAAPRLCQGRSSGAALPGKGKQGDARGAGPETQCLQAGKGSEDVSNGFTKESAEPCLHKVSLELLRCELFPLEPPCVDLYMVMKLQFLVEITGH